MSANARVVIGRGGRLLLGFNSFVRPGPPVTAQRGDMNIRVLFLNDTSISDEEVTSFMKGIWPEAGFITKSPANIGAPCGVSIVTSYLFV